VHLGQTFALEELCRDGRLMYEEKTIEGKTALHLAVAQGYAHIVETILRLHPTVDLRTRDFDGNNVFHLAAHNPNERVMSLLVNHASLVSLYSSSFETKDSEKSTRRAAAGPQIFEV
jgi:ankyrin repeat protein